MHPEVQFICLNELKLKISDSKYLAPPGYTIFNSEGCEDGYAYAAVLVRDDFAVNTKITYSKPPFCQIMFKSSVENAQELRVTSLYRPNNASVKWTKMKIDNIKHEN